MASGNLCCMLYTTHTKVCSGQIDVVEDDASPNLQHQRLAHMAEIGLKILKESLISLSNSKILDTWDYYLFCKHHRVSFSYHLRRKENKL